ncbi:hypothetical protein OG738_06315 [Amycolatopsis sp. NBC_01488]|uniref:hypothetical protein n=1 Tax=Amycolatopsis sp. NBC_01488 TaxID=2903563 RepID=UPI002E2C3CEF|nr:hypothetical protein [Amycolatopsis sp. NBC_01488]
MNTTMVFLDAIRDHLDLHAFGPVASVLVTSDSGPVTVQLDVVREVPQVASALVTWAGTLDEVSAQVWRTPAGTSVHLIVNGRMPCGIPVRVYGAVDFSEDVFPDLPVGSHQEMPVFVLRQWTRSGEVAA